MPLLVLMLSLQSDAVVWPIHLSRYGGLRWTTTTESSEETSLYRFWGDTIANFDPDIIPVGAQEMARLAHEAHAANSLAR